MAIVGPEKSWRLAHNGVVIMILEEISGHTDADHAMVTACVIGKHEGQVALA